MNDILDDDDDGEAFMLTFCVGCGCTDMIPCEPPCSWSVVHPDGRVGICSACHDDVETVGNRVIELLELAGAVDD